MKKPTSDGPSDAGCGYLCAALLYGKCIIPSAGRAAQKICACDGSEDCRRPNRPPKSIGNASPATPGARALDEVAKQALAVRKNMARLRELRLAKEAEKQNRPEAKQKGKS
jgi:hypothetical protein